MNGLEEILGEIKLLKQEIETLKQTINMKKKEDRMFSDWISEQEVILMTGLHRNTLYKLRQKGRITRSSLTGKENYYRMSDFPKLLSRNQLEN